MQMNNTTYVVLYFLKVVHSKKESRFKPNSMLHFKVFLNWLFHFVPNSKTAFVYIQICIFYYSIFFCEINIESLKTYSLVAPSQEIMWISKLAVGRVTWKYFPSPLLLLRAQKLCLFYSNHYTSFLKFTPHTNVEINLHIVTFIPVPTCFNYLKQNMYKDSHISMGTVLPENRGSVRKFIM
jgi:hypothetical protein